MATRTAQKSQTAQPMMDNSKGGLTPADLLKLERVEQLKSELKLLEGELKPKIERTVQQHGAGVVVIGDQQVRLSQVPRNSYSWKAIAYAVAEEAAVEAIKDDFAVKSVSYSAKVVA